MLSVPEKIFEGQKLSKLQFNTNKYLLSSPFFCKDCHFKTFAILGEIAQDIDHR